MDVRGPCGTAQRAARGKSSVSVKHPRAMFLPSVMLSGAPRLHGQSCRISSAESKHPEKVSVYIPQQGIFPMPPPVNRWGGRNRFPLHSRISCNDRRQQKSRAAIPRHTSGENSLRRHFFRRHCRGVSTARPSVSRLQIFSRRSAQHDSEKTVWQVLENRRRKKRIQDIVVQPVPGCVPEERNKGECEASARSREQREGAAA